MLTNIFDRFRKLSAEEAETSAELEVVEAELASAREAAAVATQARQALRAREDELLNEIFSTRQKLSALTADDRAGDALVMRIARLDAELVGLVGTRPGERPIPGKIDEYLVAENRTSSAVSALEQRAVLLRLKAARLSEQTATGSLETEAARHGRVG